jgi:hypothetical protein
MLAVAVGLRVVEVATDVKMMVMMMATMLIR